MLQIATVQESKYWNDNPTFVSSCKVHSLRNLDWSLSVSLIGPIECAQMLNFIKRTNEWRL